MNQIEKYRILSAGKAFGHRAKIALVLLDSSTANVESANLLYLLIFNYQGK